MFEPCSYSLHPKLPNPKANIMVDKDGHACLADFCQLEMTSVEASIPLETSSVPWMSPELLDPGKFGLAQCSRTKESDCYALGMVIYEVLSGETPFAQCPTPLVIMKVLRGERPAGPEAAESAPFADDIWWMLKLCWKPQPHDRISAKTILLGLEGNLSLSRQTSRVDGDVQTDTDGQSDAAASGSTCSPHFTPGSPLFALIA